MQVEAPCPGQRTCRRPVPCCDARLLDTQHISAAGRDALGCRSPPGDVGARQPEGPGNGPGVGGLPNAPDG
eukprot:1349045-Lingulodinium_polyedra.AAC.1